MKQNSIVVCITYDDNFEPMCSQLCSNLRIPGVRIKLNKTESIDGTGFGSQNWYMNLYEKIAFVRRNMDHLEDNEVICSCDADIQFFKPQHLFNMCFTMRHLDIGYSGQREQNTDDFNGGFFLAKKSNQMLDFLDKILAEDLTKYRYAEQDIINKLIPTMKIKHQHLDSIEYFHGCNRFNILPSMAKKMVMHHATCAFSGAKEKMDQMNFVRSKLEFSPINWDEYSGFYSYVPEK